MQLKQTSHLNYEERILKMKKKVVTAPHEVCIERAKLFTESYKKTKGENPIIRFAKAMENLLLNMTIKIWEDELIVGNQCKKFFGTALYPEINVEFLEQDVDTFENRLAQKMYISDEEKQIFKEEILPFWKGEESTL
ncbi:MAG: pyruvate formate lyase family protein, partial [Promethearchaeota archaeon]